MLAAAVLSLLLTAPMSDARVEDLVALISIETGEAENIIEVMYAKECRNRSGAISYCTEWVDIEDGPRAGRLHCKHYRPCHSRCRQKTHVWKNRLDVGPGIRDVPLYVNGIRTNGTSQPRKYGVRPECSLDPLCAALLMSKIIRNCKDRPPKKCNMPGVPDIVASWLPYYAAGGGASDTKGCPSRKERLLLAWKITSKQWNAWITFITWASEWAWPCLEDVLNSINQLTRKSLP